MSAPPGVSGFLGVILGYRPFLTVIRRNSPIGGLIRTLQGPGEVSSSISGSGASSGSGSGIGDSSASSEAPICSELLCCRPSASSEALPKSRWARFNGLCDNTGFRWMRAYGHTGLVVFVALAATQRPVSIIWMTRSLRV